MLLVSLDMHSSCVVIPPGSRHTTHVATCMVLCKDDEYIYTRHGFISNTQTAECNHMRVTQKVLKDEYSAKASGGNLTLVHSELASLFHQPSNSHCIL